MSPSDSDRPADFMFTHGDGLDMIQEPDDVHVFKFHPERRPYIEEKRRLYRNRIRSALSSKVAEDSDIDTHNVQTYLQSADHNPDVYLERLREVYLMVLAGSMLEGVTKVNEVKRQIVHLTGTPLNDLAFRQVCSEAENWFPCPNVSRMVRNRGYGYRRKIADITDHSELSIVDMGNYLKEAEGRSEEFRRRLMDVYFLITAEIMLSEGSEENVMVMDHSVPFTKVDILGQVVNQFEKRTGYPIDADCAHHVVCMTRKWCSGGMEAVETMREVYAGRVLEEDNVDLDSLCKLLVADSLIETGSIDAQALKRQLREQHKVQGGQELGNAIGVIESYWEGKTDSLMMVKRVAKAKDTIVCNDERTKRYLKEKLRELKEELKPYEAMGPKRLGRLTLQRRHMLINCEYTVYLLSYLLSHGVLRRSELVERLGQYSIGRKINVYSFDHAYALLLEWMKEAESHS